jgi:hypothetical protein
MKNQNSWYKIQQKTNINSLIDVKNLEGMFRIEMYENNSADPSKINT